ncbi:major facilitator superfamily domain-containing protein [Zopfochytrium polystomum]|nr:major facilitator superfamily domain-containing protein [Zopfochytrium polystomum]
MSENLASSSAVSFIGTLGAALLPMLGLFSGRIAERFGFQRMVLIGALIATSGLLLASFSTKLWQLYLTQGVLYGVGASIAYFPAVTIPNQFFSTRRGLATGLASSGSGFGGLALSLATDAMISRIGFAWCLRVTALSMLVCIAAALPALRSRFESPAPHTPTARFPPTPAHATSKPHPQPHAQPPAEPLAAMLTRLVLRDRRFQLLATGAFFATFGNLVPIYFLSAFAVRRLGAPAATGSRLIAAFDGAIGAGRVLLGLGADRAVGRLNALSACMLLSAVSMLVMWTTADSVPALAAFAVVNGVTSGGFISLYPVAVASLYGVAQLPSIYGLVFTIASVGNLAGAPLAGAIQEAAGYDAAIVYAGAVTLVSFAFVWAVRRRVEPKLLRRV